MRNHRDRYPPIYLGDRYPAGVVVTGGRVVVVVTIGDDGTEPPDSTRVVEVGATDVVSTLPGMGIKI